MRSKAAAGSPPFRTGSCHPQSTSLPNSVASASSLGAASRSMAFGWSMNTSVGNETFLSYGPCGYHRGGKAGRLFLVPHFLSHCFAFGGAGGRVPVHPRRSRHLERVYPGSDLFALRRVKDIASGTCSVQHPICHAVQPT